MSNATDPDPDPLGDVRETVGKIGHGAVAGLLWVLSGINAAGMWFGTNFWKGAGLGVRKAVGAVKWVFGGGIGKELFRAITYTVIGLLVLSSIGVIKFA